MLGARQPVDTAGRAVAQQQPVLHEVRSIGGDRAEDPRVVGWQEPAERDEEQGGVHLVGVVVLGEGVALAVEPLVEDLVAHGVAHRPPPVHRPVETVLLDAAIARSNAAQTMTREWVKWRSGPRISHRPLSGSLPVGGELLDRARCTFQERSDSSSPRVRPSAAPSSPHPARRSAPGSPPRCRYARAVIRIPGRKSRLRSGSSRLAVDAVHDLQVLRVARHRADQPAPPEPGLLDVARAHSASIVRAGRGASRTGSPSCARPRSPRAGSWWRPATIPPAGVGQQPQDEQGPRPALAVGARPLSRSAQSCHCSRVASTVP